MISESVRLRIAASLDQIEGEHAVKILFAVESGSRAWGFASPDSDYDVRFVYKRSVREYVRLQSPRDVIELPILDDLDINGWDIVKSLSQFRKSNPSLIEWLQSPIIYREEGSFAATIRQMTRELSSARRMAYHYLSMARQNYRLSIENKVEVSMKKYLYVMRPLCCVTWLEAHASPPPTEVQALRAGIALPEDISSRLDELMVRKRQAGESHTEAHDTLLDRFIETEIERMSDIVATLPDREMPVSELDRLLWQELGLEMELT